MKRRTIAVEVGMAIKCLEAPEEYQSLDRFNSPASMVHKVYAMARHKNSDCGHLWDMDDILYSEGISNPDTRSIWKIHSIKFNYKG